MTINDTAMTAQGNLVTDGGMDESQCRSIRNRVRSGASVDDVLQSTNFRWQSVIRHLCGECQHDHAHRAEPIPRDELVKRTNIDSKTCAQFRREAREEKTVMDYSKTVDYTYQTVLRHVTGECSHGIDVQPVEKDDRSEEVSLDECRSMRQKYKESHKNSFEDIAEQTDTSITTVERHIRFQCSHPPSSTLATEVNEVKDILAQGPLDCEIDESVTETQTTASTEQLDVDIAEGTDVGEDLKELYLFRCQICGETQEDEDGDRSAKTYYLNPFEGGNAESIEKDHLLVLCSDHYEEVEQGQIAIDPENLTVHHSGNRSTDGVKLTTAPSHHLDSTVIENYNERIASVDPPKPEEE